MEFLKRNICILIIMSSLLTQAKTSYLILPFTKREKLSEPIGNNFTVENFSNIYIEPTFSSIIEIGTPPQKVELIFSSEEHGIFMIEDKNSTLNYLFNKQLSSSLNITHSFDSQFFKEKPVTLIDSIFFPFYDSKLNKMSKIEVEDYPFIYMAKTEGKSKYENKDFVKENGKAYMLYGSKVFCIWKNEICENLPHFLKHNNLIDSYIFTIDFNKNQGNGNESYDFEFKIGNEPHLMSPDRYDIDSLKYINPKTYSGEMNWIIQFHEVFYFPEGFKLNNNNNIIDFNQISFNESLINEKVYNSDDRGQMAFDIDVILCPKFYYFSINKTYFGNHTNQCKIIRSKNRYSIFVCDKDFNTESFPTIYFYHYDYNYTYILTNKELFKVIGDKKYFLLVYDLYRPNFWMFGKIFLEKYLFNFDIQNKLIGFYRNIYKEKNNNYNTENKDNNNNYNILLINLIWLGIALIFGIGAFFVGKQLFSKIRKKRANELTDDNYDYQINEENNDGSQINNNNEKLYNNKIVY